MKQDSGTLIAVSMFVRGSAPRGVSLELLTISE